MWFKGNVNKCPLYNHFQKYEIRNYEVYCIFKYNKTIMHAQTSRYILKPFKQLSDIVDFMACLAYVGVVWRWTFPWKIAAMRSNEICFLCLTVCRLVYHRRPCQRATISLGNGTSMETSVAAWVTIYTENTLKLNNPIQGRKKNEFPLFLLVTTHCFYMQQFW